MSEQKWERVNSPEDTEITQRLKVYGGWVVLTTSVDKKVTGAVSQYGNVYSNDRATIAQCFVPDPNHEWIL